MKPGWNVELLAAICASLVTFGIGYNYLVARLEDRGRDRGYMGFIVALGCLITVAGAGLIIDLEHTVIVLICFAASGTPMIIGSIVRHIHQRERDEALYRESARNAIEELDGDDAA